MASGLQNQTNAARDTNFTDKVRDAAILAAISIYNEATSLTANIRSGATNVSIPIAPVLSGAIAAGTTIRVGDELFVCTAGAASGAATIPTTTTATQNHYVGEAVSPPAVAGHLRRAFYATSVLNNPDAYVHDFAAALASQSLDNSSTDAAINTGVASVWNALAGA